MIDALAPAYLAAWIAVTLAALGGLSLLCITEATSASWMVPIRRPAETLACTMIVCAVLFLPIALLASAIYPWARDPSRLTPELARAVAHKRGWLSGGPFVLRSALYLLSWTAIAELLRRWSVVGDATSDPFELARIGARRRALAAVALPWILFSGTFAAFDWVMSLEPGWYSSVFGVIFLASGGAVATAFTAAVATRIEDPRVRPAHLHAIGNMLLAAVMIWAYVFFSQILVHWIGDLPHDVEWYLRRAASGWGAIAIALGVLHFALPFTLLLVRGLKRTRALALIAALVIVGHFLDVAFLVLPGVRPSPSLLDLVPCLVVFALVAAVAITRHRRAAAVPLRDPLLARALRFEMPS